MLTGRLVRVRHARDRVIPQYIDATDAAWLEIAERLLEVFRAQSGRARAGLQEDLRETFGTEPSQLVHQGLIKLLEDRCEFEVVSGQPPEQIREAVFRIAAGHRKNGGEVAGLSDGEPHHTPSPRHPVTPPPSHPLTLSPPLSTNQSPTRVRFDRSAVLQEAAETLGLTPEAVDQGLFADLKSEQRLIGFKDVTAERLLQRYNVALAQAVLLRSTRVEAVIRGEPPQRYRQLFRLVKFHRLICQAEAAEPDGCRLRLDGPLSLFTATQKYGLELALFLPALLLCRDFDLRAELRWGPQRKPKTFTLSPAEGLVSHHADSGMYVPPEVAMFVELFRKKVPDWDIAEDARVLRLGDGFWVPDFLLTERATGRSVLLEMLGFWRRASVEQHLERLRQYAREPFLLAISEQLRIDEAELAGMPVGVYRFRQMPLPEEVARLAREVLGFGPPGERGGVSPPVNAKNPST
jgi:predicted nuclease of restriction endonuclease-like RecB superfamily